MRTTLIIFALLLAIPAQGHAVVGDIDSRLYVFFDSLPDESDLELSNDLGNSEVEDQEWEDHWRLGLGVGTQHLFTDAAGPLLTYGVELGLNRYETEDDGESLRGQAVMVSPRVGIGIHALEWLFIEGVAFVGAGASRFSYENDTFDVDEDSDLEFATEYGIQASASVALAETLLFGLRAGWMAQQLEGEFDGDAPVGDTSVESDTRGIHWGIFAGLRF
jgi:hypothetical protein